MIDSHQSTLTEQTLEYHLTRSKYSQRTAVLRHASSVLMDSFQNTLPQAMLCGDMHNSLAVIEDCLYNGSIDRARALVRARKNGNPLFSREIVQNTDMMCMLKLLSVDSPRLYRLPTSDNVHALLTQRDDHGLRKLLEHGAPMLTLLQLADLFSSQMPRTINYLLENSLLPLDALQPYHLDACIDTTNSLLVRHLISNAPAISRYLQALPPAKRSLYHLKYFYSKVRLSVQHFYDAESIRSLKTCIDTEMLPNIDVLRLLRLPGFDCFAEMPDSTLLDVWSHITTDHNPFLLWSAFSNLVDQFVEPKVFHLQFFYQSLQIIASLSISAEDKKNLVESVMLDDQLRDSMLIQPRRLPVRPLFPTLSAA